MENVFSGYSDNPDTYSPNQKVYITFQCVRQGRRYGFWAPWTAYSLRGGGGGVGVPLRTDPPR